MVARTRPLLRSPARPGRRRRPWLGRSLADDPSQGLLSLGRRLPLVPDTIRGAKVAHTYSTDGSRICTERVTDASAQMGRVGFSCGRHAAQARCLTWPETRRIQVAESRSCIGFPNGRTDHTAMQGTAASNIHDKAPLVVYRLGADDPNEMFVDLQCTILGPLSGCAGRSGRMPGTVKHRTCLSGGGFGGRADAA